MKNYTHKSKYFYGEKISEYGLKNGFVDYRTLSKAFDAVMCNDITRLFFAEIGGEYNEAEKVNGFIDNSDEIEELRERLDELEDEYRETDDEERTKQLESEIDDITDKIDELEREQDEEAEVFQWFIISDRGAEILQDLTDEIVYYIPVLDVYVWGVTHWGTSWDYVLTDIPVKLDDEGDGE